MLKPFTHCTMTSVLATVITLGASLGAAETDNDRRIESSAYHSYTFKTYLKDDSITANSRNGVVTLTGTVAEDSHRSMGIARRIPLRACPGW